MYVDSNNTIIFSSDLPHYYHELQGRKPCTVRTISEHERRKFNLKVSACGQLFSNDCLVDKIEIIYRVLDDRFQRTLTNVTKAEIDGMEIWIFSWDPAEGNETGTELP